MAITKQELEMFKEYISKKITINSHSEGCDWERCRWELNSSTEFIFDSLLEKGGCLYITGHDEHAEYIMASRYEQNDEEQESAEQGEITEILADGRPTGLASILTKISKPHVGPNITIGKRRRDSESPNEPRVYGMDR